MQLLTKTLLLSPKGLPSCKGWLTFLIKCAPADIYHRYVSIGQWCEWVSSSGVGLSPQFLFYISWFSISWFPHIRSLREDDFVFLHESTFMQFIFANKNVKYAHLTSEHELRNWSPRNQERFFAQETFWYKRKLFRYGMLMWFTFHKEEHNRWMPIHDVYCRPPKTGHIFPCFHKIWCCFVLQREM